VTIDEKLDLIIELLRGRTSRKVKYGVTNSEVRPAVMCWLETANPSGFVPMAEITRQCFLPTDKATVQAVGRVLDEQNKARAKSGGFRGFRF
jgi:hypothetical protein